MAKAGCAGWGKAIREAGIHVLYPLLEGLAGNYFIVAILAN